MKTYLNNVNHFYNYVEIVKDTHWGNSPSNKSLALFKKYEYGHLDCW